MRDYRFDSSANGQAADSGEEAVVSQEMRHQYSEQEIREYCDLFLKTKSAEDIPTEAHRFVVSKLITIKKGDVVVENLEKFHGLDYEETALKLIELLREDIDLDYEFLVAANLDKFQGVDHNVIALAIIDVWYTMLAKRKESNQSVGELDDDLEYDVADHILGLFKRYKFTGLTVQGLQEAPIIAACLLDLESTIPDVSNRITGMQLLEFFLQSSRNKQEIIETIRQNPFLTEAFFDNPRYGLKFVLKYPHLDDLSQENISLLFDVQAKFPNVKTNSREFRQNVQARLMTYRENPSILESIKNKGVNIEQWLNSDVVEMFALGKKDETSFVERAHLPMTRLKESQKKYINAYREILKLHVESFNGRRIEEDIDLLRTDLEKMLREKEQTTSLLDQAQAKEYSKDNQEYTQKLEGKIEGIKKGIQSLQSRIDHPKSVPAVDRLMGDVTRLERVMNLLNLSADAIKQNELEIYKATSDGNREMLRSLKIRQLSLEKKFRMDFESLNHQMASFEEKQKTLLQSLIGEEGAQNILQSFKAHILEDISHIQADVSTLEQLIINEDVESVSSVLEGTPMAIVMWSRNPNEDLYLGNYTDCCIRIDSAHMGEESTIADYLTDLGMQVITVRDEKRDVPVVAAWSFIGENQETGEVALVIDNIEADTNYSLAYASQLSSRLKRYFENLAKSIGVKKIVQGMDNNDLTIFKMDGRYAKLGGYNREGGYFLEGEHSDNVYDEEVEDE